MDTRWSTDPYQLNICWYLSLEHAHFIGKKWWFPLSWSSSHQVLQFGCSFTQFSIDLTLVFSLPPETYLHSFFHHLRILGLLLCIVDTVSISLIVHLDHNEHPSSLGWGWRCWMSLQEDQWSWLSLIIHRFICCSLLMNCCILSRKWSYWHLLRRVLQVWIVNF